MTDLAKYDDDGYDENLLREAKELALLGLANTQMCKVWGITQSKFNEWEKDPRFREALEAGRTVADARVANSLFRRAIGMTWFEDHVKIVGGKAEKVRVERYTPPDPWACVKWLALRQPQRWSETKKMEMTNTNINVNKFDFTGISDEELIMLKKIGLNQLVRNAGTSQ